MNELNNAVKTKTVSLSSASISFDVTQYFVCNSDS